MKKLSLFVLCFTFCSFFAQSIESTLKQMKLQGAVKSITKTNYALTEKGEKGDMKGRETLLFNAAGNLVENRSYYEDGTAARIDSSWYDSKGVLTKFTSFYSDGYPASVFTYVYDEKGNNIEQRGDFEGEANDYYIKYDDKGNAIEERCLVDGKPEGRKTWTYDSKGNAVTRTDYTAEGEVEKKYAYGYDKNGLRVEEAAYLPDGKQESKVKWKYDSRGNREESATVSGESGEPALWTYKYVYDKKGNWISCSEFNKAYPLEITERVIEYR